MFLDTPQSVIFKLDRLIEAERKNHEHLQTYETAMATVLNSKSGKKLIRRYDEALERVARQQGQAENYQRWKESRSAGGTVAQREKRANRQRVAKDAKAAFNIQTLYAFKTAGKVLNWSTKRRWKKLQFLVREVEARLPSP